MLEEAERERLGNPLTPDKPLIRLRVDYSGGFESFSTMRFSQTFVDRVANPKDILHFIRHKETKDNVKEESIDFDLLLSRPSSEVLNLRVEDLVKEYFQTAEKNTQLSMLTEQGMGKAVQEFVDKEERDAIEELVSYQLEKTQRYLQERHVEATEEKIDEEICRFRNSKKNTAEEDEEVQEAINRARAHRDRSDTARDDDFYQLDEPADISMDSDEDDTPMPPSVRGRGRGSRARGGKSQRSATRGRARGAGSQASRGGRGQKAASSPVKTKSIMDVFRPSRGSRSSTKSYEELIIEDSDSEDDVSVVKTARPAQKSSSFLSSSSGRSSQSHSQSNKGICFDDDDDEFDPFKTAGRRGRR